MKITIPASTLAELVNPILPLVANGRQLLPILSCVLIRSKDGYLTATGTDRYRMGVQRAKVEGVKDGLRVAIHRSVLKQILTTFKATRSSNPDLVLEFTSASVKVSTEGFGEILDAAITYPLERAEYPRVDSIITNALAAKPTAETAALNPSLLAAFQHAQTQGEPMIVTITGKNSPVAIRIGDDFVGALMVMRGEATDASQSGWESLLEDEPEEKVA